MADEKKIEQYLTKQVEKRGGMCVKFIPDYFAGFPDRILILPAGQTIYVELKAPHVKSPAPLQRIIHERLLRLGHWIEVCNTRELIDELMIKYDEAKT